MKGVRDMKYTMTMTFDDIMYELCVMAVFFVEGANLLVPCRENANFNRVLSRFTSFFKGFIGAGGWGIKAQKPLGTSGNYGKINREIHDYGWMTGGLYPL